VKPSLNEIAVRTGTDKSDRHHGYTWVYEEYLAPLRDQPITLLEIGVADGASLKMWREYFPHARIYGLDRDPACRALAGDRIEVFVGDQSDARCLAEVIRRTGPLNLVIDDGSHIGEHQIESFESLFPAVTEGGLYVVEDLHTSYWGWGTRSAMQYFKSLVDAAMITGKSQYAEIRNDPNCARLEAQLGYFEKTVESVQFHRSLVFIRKRRARPETPYLQIPSPDEPGAVAAAFGPTVAGPNVAIVVPVHNALEHVQRSLGTIVATYPNVPLIVVDDASDPQTHAWMQRFLFEQCPAQIRSQHALLRNERQQLFTRTANRGIRYACATQSAPIDFIAVVNSDCELQENWLTALLWAMEDPNVGVVGYAEWPDGEEPAFRQMQEPDYISGHCLLLRRQMLAQIGVFCETDVAGGPDSPGLSPYLGQAHVGSDRALSWRANRAGWQTLYCHYLLCHHQGAASWRRDLQWLSQFDLQPLWPACDQIEHATWNELPHGMP
jgi:GT2 family glycosyltransferase